jgi:glycosyltransferase involved in cell wall biosynthesis
MPPYKVAFLTTSMNRGGKESRLVDVLRGLDRAEFDPFLFVAKNTGDLLAEVHDQRVYIGSSGNILKSLPELWRVLRREQPDVVWCLQSNVLSFAGRLFAWLLRTPAVVLSIHGHHRNRAIVDWPNRAITRWTTDRVVVLSQIYCDWLVKEGFQRDWMTVQYNGVDTERFSPPATRDAYKQEALKVDPSRAVIGTVGNLRRSKATEVFVQAAKRVIEDRPDAMFVIVGEGERRAILEQMRDELGLAEHLLLLGKRTDIPDLMRAFDLFCLTSDYGEGCSNVTLEAMASGLTVITTNFGGASELVDESVGVIVPVQDDAALADAILQLLDDPARRAAMGQAGRRRAVEQFSLDTMMRKREALLLELLEKRSGSNPVK